MPETLMNNTGGKWVLGVAGATRYPLTPTPANPPYSTVAGQGDGTATAASSALTGAKSVLVIGILVSATAAVAVSVVDHNGTDLPGITMTQPAVGFHKIGVIWTGTNLVTSTGNANVGIKCGAGLTATLIYEQLA